MASTEGKLQNYKPLKLTAFDNWLQYFEGRSGNNRQKTIKYLARETGGNIQTRNSTDWGLRQATEGCNAGLCFLRDITASLKRTEPV